MESINQSNHPRLGSSKVVHPAALNRICVTIGLVLSIATSPKELTTYDNYSALTFAFMPCSSQLFSLLLIAF